MKQKKDSLPIRWCNLRCPQAKLPSEEGLDGSGSCRTFSAIYCSDLKRYVLKNARCPGGKPLSSK